MAETIKGERTPDYLDAKWLTDEELASLGARRVKYLPGVEGHKHVVNSDGCALCGMAWKTIVVEV